METQIKACATARQLFVLDARALDDLHTLAGRLGVSYSHVVRESLHLAAERLRYVDQPEVVSEPVPEGTKHDS